MQGRIYTRHDIVRILDTKIADEIDRMGEGSFWAKVYRDRKVHMLAQYDAGEAIVVEYEEYVEKGITYGTYYYSNGSIKNMCY